MQQVVVLAGALRSTGPWAGLTKAGVALLVALATSVMVVVGRGRHRRREAAAWSGWVRQ
jgi:hypothetical protein